MRKLKLMVLSMAMLSLVPQAVFAQDSYITENEKDSLKANKEAAFANIEDFFQVALNEKRDELLELAKPYGNDVYRAVRAYFEIVGNIYKRTDDETTSLYSAFAYMQKYNGVTIPSKLVAKIFDMFSDLQGMSDFAKVPLQKWLNDDLEGVKIFTDENGLVNLWFKPKAHIRKRMTISFAEDSSDPDSMVFTIAIKTMNKFVFKNKDVKSNRGTQYLYNDFRNFFDKRGLLTEKMETLDYSKEAYLDVLNTYFKKQKATSMPTFVEIQGFEFFVKNSGIPFAGTLSPEITEIVILPGFEKVDPKYLMDAAFMKIQSLVNVEMPIGSF